MANVNAPFGAMPLTPHSGIGAPKVGRYYCDANAAIHVGDIVKLGTDSDTAGVHEVVALAAGAGDPVGIVVGIERHTPSLPDNQFYKKAADVVYLQVADDPDLMFLMQCSNGTLTAAMAGLNADVAVSAGVAPDFRSKTSLDVATLAVTATLPIRLIGVEQKINNALGAEAVVRCAWNLHAYRTDRVAV